MLDRVQKGFEITKEQSDYLRKDNLIEGKYPNIYISTDIAKITNKEKDYIDYILTYIEKFGKATREEINNLIYPKLPTNMKERNKNKIENEGSLTKSSWIIKK